MKNKITYEIEKQPFGIGWFVGCKYWVRILVNGDYLIGSHSLTLNGGKRTAKRLVEDYFKDRVIFKGEIKCPDQ